MPALKAQEKYGRKSGYIRYKTNVSRSFAFLSLLLFLTVTTPLLAATIYVDIDAIGSNDGSAWSNAYTDLSVALSSAVTNDQLWVAQGTYVPGTNRTSTFMIPTDVSIYGGFAAWETNLFQRASEENPTILSGDLWQNDDGFLNNSENAYHVLTCTNANIVIDGFVISGGNANSSEQGGGIRVLGVSPEIRDCIIVGNAANNAGGIFLSGSSAQIIDCFFSDNFAFDRAGGIYITNSPALIEDSLFVGNKGDNWGGAMSVIGSSLTVTRNTLFSGNSSTNGGALYVESTGNSFENCTFANNLAYDSGGALYEAFGASYHSNSIYWGNDAITQGEEIHNASGWPIFWYCDIQGGINGLRCSGSSLSNAVGNINSDPLFVSSTNTYTWTQDATFNTNRFQTILHDSIPLYSVNELFDKLIQPDTNSPLQYLVASNTASEIFVWGNVTAIATNGGKYKIHDYHLQSTAGHWEDGPGVWTNDAQTSPCIDAGDPISTWTNEPSPNGTNINMGAYGNTPDASKTAGALFPEIDITGNGFSITNNDTFPSATDGTDFGPIQTGNYWTNLFTITNSGSATLLLDTGNFGVSGPHTNDFIIGYGGPTNIAPGASQSFGIVFMPSIAGSRTGIVNIVNNDSDESNYTFQVAGIGAGTPVINNNGGASNITATTAQLTGYLVSTGGVLTEITFCLGDDDAGTNYGAWDQTFYIGYYGVGPLSYNATNLLAGSNYFYTTYASNLAGEAWAPASTNFSALVGAVTGTITQIANGIPGVGVWGTNVNWSPASIPNLTNDVILQSYSNAPYELVSSGYSAECNNADWLLNMTGIAGIMSNASLHVYGYFSNSVAGASLGIYGDMTVDGHFYNNPNYLFIGPDGPGFSSARLTNNSAQEMWSRVMFINCSGNTEISVPSGIACEFLLMRRGTKSVVTNKLRVTSGFQYNYDLARSEAISLDAPTIDLNSNTVSIDVRTNCSLTITGTITNGNLQTGTYTDNSAGKVFLTGWNDFGTFNVNNGMAFLNGTNINTLGSAIMVMTNFSGTLGGSGLVNKDISIYDTAHFNPGPDTLTIGTYRAPNNDITIYAGGILSCELDGTNQTSDSFICSNLTITGSTIDFNLLGGSLATNQYILATYSNLVGTFGITNLLPVGYGIDYNLGGSNQIALVTLPVTPPSIANGPVSNITATAADFIGNLTSTGSSATVVELYWGPTDGATTNALWSNNVSFGTINVGPIVTNITPLTANTAYYYRYYATNSAGESWCPVSTIFTTAQATVQFAVTTASAPESVTITNIGISLSDMSGADVTVDYSVVGGTAIGSGTDYTLVSGVATVAMGSTFQNIPLNINNDISYEPNETIFVSISNSISASMGVNTNYTYTILDDDSMPSISIAPANVIEGNSGTTTMTFNVGLDISSGYDTYVDYLTVTGTASTADSDYVLASGNLTISNGLTNAQIMVTVNGDTKLESGTESLYVLLLNATNATIAVTNAQGDITDDDTGPGISINDVGITEIDAGTTGTLFNVTIDAVSGLDVSVDFTTADNTATIGDSDYLFTNGTVTIPAGSTNATIYAEINGDTKFEANESFFVNLSTPVNGSISDGQGSLLITDNDPMPQVQFVGTGYTNNENIAFFTFNASISAAAGQTVTVDFASSDITTVAGSDYDATNGVFTWLPGDSANKSINLYMLNDSTDEPLETMNGTLSNPSNCTIIGINPEILSILDDDPPPNVSITGGSVFEGDAGTTALVFSVSLATPSALNVYVDYSSSNNTATLADSDYIATNGNLMIPAGNSNGFIIVEVNGDTNNETNETIGVNLGFVTNGITVLGSAFGTVMNDDGIPNINISDAVVTEGDAGQTSLVFNVTLDALSGVGVAVDFVSADITATSNDVDYAVTNGTLSFTPGTTNGQIIVIVNGDTKDEPASETMNVILSSPSNCNIADGIGQGTINDDDTPPTISFNATPYSIGEAGPFITISAAISAVSGLDVAVDFASSDGSASSATDYDTTNGTMTWLAGDSTIKSFDLYISDDGVFETNETVFVTLSAPSNCTIFGTNPETVTITDDDSLPTVSFGATPYSASESAGPITITVGISSISGQDVTIDYATSDNTASSASDYSAASGTLTWLAGTSGGRSFNIPLSDDAFDELAETINVTLLNPTNCTIFGTNPESASIVNDDGSISITINPVGVATSANWRLTTGPDTSWHLTGEVVSNVAGSGLPYTVTFNNVTGWTKPGDASIAALLNGALTVRTRSYTPGNLILISGGTFQMGVNEQGHGGHTVSVGDFLIEAYEVSQSNFQAYCTANTLPMPPQPVVNPNLPVVNVTWQQARNYATWKGYRLPTEAEYEYAMRANQRYTQYFPWGNSIGGGNARYNNGGGAVTIGSYAANAYGLYDISGNVWEWCSDWHSDHLSGPTTDPQGPGSGSDKVIRGGAWSTTEKALRVYTRYSLLPSSAHTDLGFRCAKTAGSGVSSDVDNNNNGVPDWWEVWYFGSTSGFLTSADSDGDGMINWQEYVAGTCPTSAASVLRMQLSVPAPLNYAVSWPSAPGRMYTLERSTNLPAFNLLQNNIPATAPMNTYTDVVGGAGSYFYRVIVQP